MIHKLIQDRKFLNHDTSQEISIIRTAFNKIEENFKHEVYLELNIDDIWEKAVALYNNQNK